MEQKSTQLERHGSKTSMNREEINVKNSHNFLSGLMHKIGIKKKSKTNQRSNAK